jgi:hypothetical protein
MPTLVEINGLDEGGKVGEPIWLVRVGVRIDSELQLLLKNLENFGKLFVRKNDLYGREEKNLVKYVHDAIDDPGISLSIFRMRVQTQIWVIREYFKFLCDDMFKARKSLIDGFKSAEEGNGPNEEVWQVVETLKRFENHPFLYESLVKSYGMMNLTAKLDSISALFRTTLMPNAKCMIVIQIDGGYPFAFWWQNLVQSHHLSNIKKMNAHISGVSQGDAYYPTVSTAGAIAYILNKYPHRTSFLPINELTYDSKFPVDEEFYNKHTTALIRPTFDNRMVFVGTIDPDLMACLPYCLHRGNRRKTYEPFCIEISAESFFNKYGVGKQENTLIVTGRLSSKQNKEDAQFCKSKNFQCVHLADLRESFERLCTDIESEIDLLHKEKKTKLTGKFEQIKKGCLSEFE